MKSKEGNHIPDILWMTVQNPKKHKPKKAALRTAGIDMDDGTCYVHSSLGSSEEKNFYAAAFDGNVKVINNNNDLYIDTSWMRSEYPKYKEVINKIEERLMVNRHFELKKEEDGKSE